MTGRLSASLARQSSQRDVAPPALPPRLITLVAASALSPLAINIFIPSMSSIARDLSTNAATAGLGLSLYLFAVTILQLVAGPLSDRYGRRPLILWGLGLFLAGTLLCLVAESILPFLIGRVLQAASATGIAISRAVVRDVYERRRAAAMLGYVTMGLAVAPMIGPAIGGTLDTAFGWRSVFWLLLGLGVFVFAVVYRDLRETNFNLGGSVAAQMEGYGRLLRQGRFWLYCGVSGFASGSFFAFLGGASIVAIERIGLTPAEYGYWFIFCPLGYAAGNFLTGRFSERVGIKRMMVVGTTLVVAATCTIAVPIVFFDYLTAPTLFVPLVVLGLGCGLAIPTSTAGGVSVSPDSAGAAAGLLGAVQLGTGAIASTIAAVLATGQGGAHALALLMVALGAIAFMCALGTPRHED